jgi:hypothetical protein
MDDQTLIASLRNDLSKLEKQIAIQNTDMVSMHTSIENLKSLHRSHIVEEENKYLLLKNTFIELLNTYIVLKARALDMSEKKLKQENYEWYEKSGII